MGFKEWIIPKPLWFKFAFYFSIIVLIIFSLYELFFTLNLKVDIIDFLSFVLYILVFILLGLMSIPLTLLPLPTKFSDLILRLIFKDTPNPGILPVPDFTLFGIIFFVILSFIYGAIIGLIISRIKLFIRKIKSKQ